ncbi:hypothetical protein EVAR_56833_1 [Eumeta japonica]|uniref:Uncharacterized protein n=1 Tax=Eumeta variegata TaxID=151549 RepID=A0A4C1ZER6_EUMVA|nr:hypothetical protein EVAR_56833_1 [Eumeta japonica]
MFLKKGAEAQTAIDTRGNDMAIELTERKKQKINSTYNSITINLKLSEKYNMWSLSCRHADLKDGKVNTNAMQGAVNITLHSKEEKLTTPDGMWLWGSVNTSRPLTDFCYDEGDAFALKCTAGYSKNDGRKHTVTHYIWWLIVVICRALPQRPPTGQPVTYGNFHPVTIPHNDLYPVTYGNLHPVTIPITYNTTSIRSRMATSIRSTIPITSIQLSSSHVTSIRLQASIWLHKAMQN